jgi:hypothetical protein
VLEEHAERFEHGAVVLAVVVEQGREDFLHEALEGLHIDRKPVRRRL